MGFLNLINEKNCTLDMKGLYAAFPEAMTTVSIGRILDVLFRDSKDTETECNEGSFPVSHMHHSCQLARQPCDVKFE